MKPANKILISAVLAVVGGILVLGALVHFFGGQILKTAVSKAAGKALGTSVYISDVDLSIIKGDAAIKGLEVRNPAGYEYKNLLELRNSFISASLWSLLGSRPSIKRIQLDGVELVIEQKLLSNNLAEVLKSMPAQDRRQDAPKAKKLRIDELEISDITVKVKVLPVPGKADTLTLKLAPIRMTNLGGDDKLSTEILAGKIITVLANSVMKEGRGVLPADILNPITPALKETIGVGKEAGRAVSEEAKKIVGEGEKAIEGLKDLLGGKKDKEK